MKVVRRARRRAGRTGARERTDGLISWLKSFLSPGRERAAHALYVAAVEQARTPAFYLTGGVADTLDGRFDLIALHLWLEVTRLHRPAGGEETLAGAALDLEERLLAVHFADMDQALREMGVGDLGVGKKIKAMAQAFYGRAAAYDAAFEVLRQSGRADEVRAALDRNVYREAAPSEAALNWLTDYAVAARRLMDGQALPALLEGRVLFPDVVAAGASAPGEDEASRKDEE